MACFHKVFQFIRKIFVRLFSFISDCVLTPSLLFFFYWILCRPCKSFLFTFYIPISIGLSYMYSSLFEVAQWCNGFLRKCVVFYIEYVIDIHIYTPGI